MRRAGPQQNRDGRGNGNSWDVEGRVDEIVLNTFNFKAQNRTTQ